jgi:hypothetical protein
MIPRPAEICGNCFAIYIAAKPRPPGAWCWHSAHVARPTSSGWHVEKVTGRRALAALREEGVR